MYEGQQIPVALSAFTLGNSKATHEQLGKP